MKLFIVVVAVLAVVIVDFSGSVASRNVEARSKSSYTILKKDQIGKRVVARKATVARRTTCSSDQFLCTQAARCIPSSFRCDGDNDCGDFSDETYCGDPTQMCSLVQFHCVQSAKCIPRSYQCDGDNDCGDFSDEANCGGFRTTTVAAPACSSEQFQCANLERCIPRRWLCDGDSDCSDRSDEANCGTTTTVAAAVACSSEMFRCTNLARCIPMTWMCDGDADCSDRSDEANCAGEGQVATDGPATTPEQSFGDWMADIIEQLST